MRAQFILIKFSAHQVKKKKKARKSECFQHRVAGYPEISVQYSNFSYSLSILRTEKQTVDKIILTHK